MARKRPQSAKEKADAIRRRENVTRLLLAFIIILIIAIIGYAGVSYIPPLFAKTFPSPTPVQPQNHLFFETADDGEPLGISDGTYIFDTTRHKNARLKQDGAQKLKNGDRKGAEKLWQEAASQDTSDAEILIYLENQYILDSQRNSITLVVGTILTGSSAGSGEDSLQGAYVAQKEYNDQCLKKAKARAKCMPIRLLIANSGSGRAQQEEENNANFIAQQIVSRQKVLNIVGVMGWPSSSVLGNDTDHIFTNAQLAIVSPTALLNESTNPLFIFSVAPSNTRQGNIGAYYAEHVLNAKRVAVFVDPSDFYSQSLEQAFNQKFLADGQTISSIENYTIGVPATIQAGWDDAQKHNPNLIYFAGHASDVSTLLRSLPDCSQASCMNILGGDGLYELSGYANDIKSSLYRLHFTAFAYPDEWLPIDSAERPAFFKEYSQDFYPDNPSSSSDIYGLTRADNLVILSYDALTVLEQAISNITHQVTTESVQKALVAITGSGQTQGISGVISFGNDGNPLNKVVVALYFDTNQRIHQDQCFGSFLKDTNGTAICNAL